MDYPKITIKAARVNKGLKQTEAAALLHVDRRSLQHYESGKIIPKWSVVKRMEELYGVPADYLIFGRDSA